MINRIILSLVLSLFLFSNIAFAQDFDDIGSLLFRDILQMNEYPGAPFTGNIGNDLIMFLLVPSVFIILVVYMLLGRLFWHTGGQGKLRVLVGITIYLFIIAGGYYSAFARLAGPYFLVLIFIYGLLYFFFGHFSIREGGGYSAGGGGYSRGGGSLVGANMANANDIGKLKMMKDRIEKQIHKLEDKMSDLHEKIARLANKNPPGDTRAFANQLGNLEGEKLRLEQQKGDIEQRIDELEVAYAARAGARRFGK